MTIVELQQLYASHPNVEGACRLLADASVRRVHCGGLCASAVSLFFSAVVQRGGCPFVFVGGDLEEAGYLYHDLSQVLGEEQVLFFPSSFRRAIKYGQKDAANWAASAWSPIPTRWWRRSSRGRSWTRRR